MTAPALLDLPADWVTLRAVGDGGLPLVVLVDRAVAVSAPHDGFGTQVAVAVQYGQTPDGQPAPEQHEGLRTLEQALVDAGAGQARLVAVMTLEGVREWVLYARDAAWASPFAEAGLSVVVSEDPGWTGLAELTGRA